MKVWLPGSAPGVHSHNLSLEQPNALLFFLESVARGNVVYPHNQKFTIVAYQGVMQLGMGIYQVVGVADPCLEVMEETGEMVGVVREAWINMIRTTKLFDEQEAL
jgi:hypothetical protein